ncbi:MAG: DcaP family trimeric outer membrane transporter [Aquisalinus sp.]|nr:DcaP family trimeric outer membrane transporter [Aquisalinus sp.]
MKNQNAAKTLKKSLVTAVSLFALSTPAYALGGDDLESRVSALESKLDLILEKLETTETSITAEQAATLMEANTLLKEAVATANSVPANQTAVVQIPTATPVAMTATAPQPAAPATKGFAMGDTQVSFSGFVKLDASVTDFDSGELPTNSLGRDFYIPGTIPVGGEGTGPVFDFNPRETRFIFGMNSNRGGHDIGGKIELDFQVTNDGNERVSNSFSPRMRQAYLTFDKWLIGQTWSTFQDVAALPDNLDFIGPTEGTVFERQPMIRYKNGPIEIAIEQPETEITTSTGARLLPGDDPLPDLTARYTNKGDWGHMTVAGIVRNLKMEEDLVSGAKEDTALGYGISLAGKLKVGHKDDFRYMLTAGEGIGRYVGVNIVNDAAVDTNGELETIGTLSGFASYRHFWNDSLRSNLTAGYFKADNPVAFTGSGVTDEVYSVHANLIYQIAPKLDVGVEYIYANRELESGIDGAMNKIQFSAKYGF